MKKVIFTLALALVMLPLRAATDFENAVAALNEKSLPLVNLTLDVSQMTKANYIAGHIDVADPLKRTTGEVMASFNCLLRWRGESSLYYNKKSLAVKIVDDAGEEMNVNMLGIREKENWILDAMACDRLRMRNRVLFDLWNEASRTPWETDYDRRNGTIGYFVEVYFNGAYQGLYCMTDKIDRKLLGLKKAKVNSETGDVTVRGVLYKCEKHTAASYMTGWTDDDNANTTVYNGFELKLPEDYPSKETWQPLQDAVTTSANLDASELKDVYQDYFYRDNLIDYMILLMAFRISDNSLKNTYIGGVDMTKDKRMIITPWDLDASLGNRYDGYWLNKLTEWRFLTAVSLYNKLYFNDEDFKQAFRDRWVELRGDVFSHANLKAKMTAYAQQITESGAWARERAKWNNNPVSLQANLYDEVDIISEWYTRELEEMNTLFETPWKVSTVIEQVNCAGDNATPLYYDLSGRPVGTSLESLAPGIYITSTGRKVLKSTH